MFDQVFAKLLPGTAQIVNASHGFAAVSHCANPEWFVDCSLCNLVRYHWTNAALVLREYCRDRLNLLVENLLVALCMVHYMFTGADCSH